MTNFDIFASLLTVEEIKIDAAHYNHDELWILINKPSSA